MIAFNEPLMHKLERYSFSPSEDAKENLFYPISIGHFSCGEDYYFSPTEKTGYFLIFIVKGSLMASVEKQKEEVFSNSLLLTDAKSSQSYYTTSQNLEYVFLHFDGIDAKHLFRFIQKQCNFIISPETPKAIKKFLKALLWSLKEKKILPESEMSSKIYEILCDCLRSTTVKEQHQEKNTENYDKSISFAESYIQKNLNTPLTVKAIARQVNMSSSHFSKVFKSETGFSPYDYVLNARLQKAKNYLADTDKSIEQIAFLTGFNSESNFIYFFTTNTGTSPLKYRNKLK